MKRIIKYLFIVLIGISFANAEPEIDFLWLNSFGGSKFENFKKVIKVEDGYVAIGNSSSKDLGIENKGNTDIIIVKYDLNGKEIWKNIFGGSGIEDASSIAEVEDGYLVVGWSDSGDAGFVKKGQSSGIVIKYDREGNQKWLKNLGGDDNTFYRNLVIEEDGFVVIGQSDAKNLNFKNNELVTNSIMFKYDFEGNLKEAIKFGGNDAESFYSILVDDDGYIIGGESYTSDDFFKNNGLLDGVILKLDKKGNRLWTNNFGGNRDDNFQEIVEVEDGYVAVGYSSSEDAGFENKGRISAIIVKYDKNGKQLWFNNFGGSGIDSFNSVVSTEDGYIAVGDSSSKDAGFILNGIYDAVAVKYDFDGNKKWIKNLGIKEKQTAAFNKIIKDDYSYIIVGEINSSDFGIDTKGHTNGLILKFDDVELLKKQLNKLLDELNSLIKEDDIENKNFYNEVKKSIDSYNTEELKTKREETKKRIANLKNKVDNPSTGLKTNILILIVLILGTTLIYRLSKKENYI